MPITDYQNIVHILGSNEIGNSNKDEEIFGEHIAEEDIPMGSFITIGSARGLCKKPTASTDKIMFVPPMEKYLSVGEVVDKIHGTSNLLYKQFLVRAKNNVPYVYEAYKVRLLVNVNVLKGEAIYVDLTTGLLTNVSTGNCRLGNSFFEYDVLAGNYHITSFHLL
jgi:hypothetical protein